MLKKDYLLEMIGAMSEAIGKIIFHKNKGDYIEAHIEADNMYQSLTGMPLSMLLTIPGENLLDFLSSFGEIDPRKALLLVDLLKEDADVYQQSGDTETEKAMRLKCEELLNTLDRYELEEDVLIELDKRMAFFGID